MKWYRVGLALLLLAAFLCPMAVPQVAAQTYTDPVVLYNQDAYAGGTVYSSGAFGYDEIFVTCTLTSSGYAHFTIWVDGGASAYSADCDGTQDVLAMRGRDVQVVTYAPLLPTSVRVIVYGLNAPGTPTPTPDTTCQIDPGYNNTEGYTWNLRWSGHWVFPQTNTGTGSGVTLPYDPITSTVVVAGLFNFSSTNSGYSSYLVSDNIGSSPDVHHLFGFTSPGYLYLSGNGQTSRVYHYPDPDADVTAADICVWSLDTPAATPTMTPVVTQTPLATPPPSYGSCIVVSSGTDGIFFSGDFYGRQFRVYERPTEPTDVVTMAIGTTSGLVTQTISDTSWRTLGLHSTSVRWTALGGAFKVQICAVSAPPGTLTPTSPVFVTPSATATQTATPTVTPTGTQTATATATRTPAPTPTVPGTCATPDSEDSAECAILELLKTPPALTPPTMEVTPLPNISTTVAIICEKDPCNTAGVVIGGAIDIIGALEENQNAPDCGDLVLPDFGGSADFKIPDAGVAEGFCWMINTTTWFREWVRIVSVLFAFFLLFKYFMLSMRRMGDV